MTDKTVPQLTAASALTGAELMHVVQGGNPRKVALNQIKDSFNGGWASYSDFASALEVNAIAINACERTLVTIDGGTGTITSHIGNSEIQWVANEHRGMTVGDSFSWRLDFIAKKSGGTDAYIICDLDIADGTSTVASNEQPLRATGTGRPMSFTFVGYSLDTFAANGGRFYITSSANISIWAKRVFIRRDYHPVT